MLIGAHVSVAGGYDRALDYAAEVGCECLQMFAKSPRQWKASPIDTGKAEAFVAARRERGFGPVFTHTAYLINLSTSDAALREKSIAALADELVRGALLGASGVVTHIGNDPDADPEAAAVRASEAIRQAFETGGDAVGTTRLLLENTAGAGRTYGSSFEQLGRCIELADLPAEALGVCLDTCHGFAAGMPLDSAEGWSEVLGEMANCIDLGRLGLIHANDCMFEQGSRRDRHAWIGDGFIGVGGFRAMVCRPELTGVCACTEMPGEVPEKDAENIQRLKELRSACA